MKTVRLLLFLIMLLTSAPVFAQEELDDDFDFSSLVPAESVKAFCSSRILNGGPQKLFSVGYELQGSHDLEAGSWMNFSEQTARIDNLREFSVDIQYPVVSKNNITLALQFNYLNTQYDYDDNAPLSHPLHSTLDENGLNSATLSTVIFKPLNLTNFLIIQAGASLNGDYSLSDIQPLSYSRLFGAVIYGWKPNDRKMWGVGVSRTYLGGALNYLPIFYYQYSSADGKWGVDALFPSRLNLKRNFSPQSILSIGHNFQGNTYRLNSLAQEGDQGEELDPELRRSELRFRAIFDRAITRTLWFTLQGGLRYNWEFNVDDGDFFRSLFAEDPYLFENELGNPLYFQFSISWVSP